MSFILMPGVATEVVEAMVVMVNQVDMVSMVWMPQDTQVELMVVQEALAATVETQPMVLMVVMEASSKSLFQKPTWISSKCSVRSWWMEVSEDVPVEMDAEAMAVRVGAVAAPTHTAQQGLSIILITMDIIKPDTTQIGTQIQVASLAPTAQMATLVTLKSSLVEMETKDPMNSLLSILPALSNIKTDMMLSF